MRKTTFGVIIGNRGIFPGELAASGRAELLGIIEREGYDAICLSPEQTRFGAVETLAEATVCADLFRRNADKIDGIVISLPNFGDERGIADALRMAGLKVPILVHAFSDSISHFSMSQRRDAFCGKMSVCSNLAQYNLPFTLTSKHTLSPSSPAFLSDLRNFAITCRVVRGLTNVRFGSVGARPGPFNSVRYSEKILEHAGITIDTLDMADVLGRYTKLHDEDVEVTTRLKAICSYTNTSQAPAESLVKMAKLATVLEKWIQEARLVGVAIQCWSALQDHLGIVPCTVMSMFSNGMLPAACEVDVTGAVGMYALQLASGTPSAIVDWNNNYEEEDDKCVLFHCSNFPKGFYKTETFMDAHEMLLINSGRENTWGTLQGRIKTGPMTFLRLSTDDVHGELTAYAAEGVSLNDPAPTWGGTGVIEIPRLQELLSYICTHKFEHHVSVNLSSVGTGIVEALRKYLGYKIYAHAVPGHTAHQQQ